MKSGPVEMIVLLVTVTSTVTSSTFRRRGKPEPTDSKINPPSSTCIISTGVHHGCVLTPLFFSLSLSFSPLSLSPLGTNECTSLHPDDIAAHRQEAERPALWCGPTQPGSGHTQGCKDDLRLKETLFSPAAGHTFERIRVNS